MTEKEVLDIIERVEKEGNTVLYFSFIGLKTLPPNIGNLTNLTKLYLRDNFLKLLPSEIGNLTNLTMLNLHKNQLTALPSKIGKLLRLIVLYLGKNQLTSLPSEIWNLSGLTNLDLYFNQLTVLPPEIGKLTNLRKLDLSQNQLTALPSEIGELTNLTTLYLSQNQLTALPPEIGKLTNLTTLGLGRNQLKILPNEIVNLINLSELDLGENQLVALPPDIRKLTKLIKLVLSECKVVDRSNLLALSRLPKLRHLDVSGCPQLKLPEEVIRTKDPRHIAEAIEAIEAGETLPMREVKIVVLGDGLTGKSQLVNRLRGLDFQQESISTATFNIYDSLVVSQEKSREHDVVTRIYDFGGQPHLWSAHRFFLASGHNLYIIVIDGTRQGLSRLEYWLEYVCHYTRQRQKKIPVLIVFTHCDLEMKFTTLTEAEDQILRQKYEDFSDILFVRRYSSATDEGLPEVLQKLAKLVRGMNYVFDTQYTKALYEVKQYLQGKSDMVGEKSFPPFNRSITQRDLYTLFAEAKASKVKKPDEEECKVWLTILRNLGIVHWVGDMDGIMPRDTMAKTIYAPQWVQKLVYSVICADDKIKQSGIAKESTLCRIMCDKCAIKNNCPEPCPLETGQECHQHMIGLMETCGLIFHRRVSRQWLVLDWLDKADVENRIISRPVTSRVHFATFLPESLLPRFAGTWFHEDKEGQYWRDCAKVSHPQYDRVEATVLGDVQKKCINVWVEGGTDEEQFNLDAQVRAIIEDIASREKLAFQEHCWVQVAQEPNDDVPYIFYPPCFVIRPEEASFADAWENFCCEMLNLAERTREIRRRRPPEQGIDLIWPEQGIAYQCKSVIDPETGRFNQTYACKSIETALACQTQTGWKEFVICSNIDITGDQEQNLTSLFPDLKLHFLTEGYWRGLCREYHHKVYHRFRVLMPLRKYIATMRLDTDK